MIRGVPINSITNKDKENKDTTVILTDHGHIEGRLDMMVGAVLQNYNVQEETEDDMRKWYQI